MRILVVEDDMQEATDVREILCAELHRASVEIILTEKGFREALPSIRASPPDLIILDQMIAWQERTGRDVEPPPGKPRVAGLRCIELLKAADRTRDVPIIVYTILDAVPEIASRDDIFFVAKSGDSERLIRTVRSVLAASQKLLLTQHNTASDPFAVSAITRDSVFISYSHKDKKFLDQLLAHLKPLGRSGRVAAWSDQQLSPGALWLNEIERALASSRVAVLMVSKDFLASDFIHEHELGPILKRAEEGGVRILWFLLRACSYKETALKNYQAILPLSKPVAEMKAERDRAWVSICEAISEVLGTSSTA